MGKGKSSSHYKEILRYSKGMDIPIMNLTEIDNLFNYFEKEKIALNMAQVQSTQETAIDKDTNKVQAVVDGHAKSLSGEIKSEGEKTRKAMAEILTNVNKSSSAQKNYMLSRYSQSEDIIKNLLDHGCIVEYDDQYAINDIKLGQLVQLFYDTCIVPTYNIDKEERKCPKGAFKPFEQAFAGKMNFYDNFSKFTNFTEYEQLRKKLGIPS
jgi:hypothetical protein